MDAATLAIIFGAFFAAGAVKGVIGLGLPTVSLALVTLALPLQEALALTVLPTLITNLWQAAVGGRLKALLARSWPMLLCNALGVWAGAMVLFHVDVRLTTAALGLVLAVYAVLGLSAVRFRVRPGREPYLSPLVGAATGVIGGTTGTHVLPAVPYFQALGLEKDALLQAMGLSFSVSSIVMLAALADYGALHRGNVLASALGLVPALVGMAAGQNLRSFISPELFRTCLFVGLLLLALHLVYKNIDLPG